MNNRKYPESDLELEEGEEEDSDFDNHETSGRNGYTPIHTNVEDELNLHTDGEINTGEKKSTENQKEVKIEITELEKRRSKKETKQTEKYGGIPYTKKLLDINYIKRL